MTPTAYPLQWPAGWPKTEIARKEEGRFKTTLSSALNMLKDEVRLLGGKALVLSSNYTLGNENPKESGVVAYFEYEGQPVAIPCDRWKRVEANVKAIALTVEAMRGMERWGAKAMIKAMFTGFKQLPQGSVRAWHEVLGVSINASIEQVKEAYRILVKKHHPDVGGDAELFRRVNEAYQQFQNQ
jgi:DnaJ-like protein